MNDLDHKLAEQVMGWRLEGAYWVEYVDYPEVPGSSKIPEGRWHKDGWSPSENIDQAFMVVEKLHEREYRLQLEHIYRSLDWRASLFADDRAKRGYGYAESPSMAICLAAEMVLEAT